MAISTAGDLIAWAFRASGITGAGQTPTADDSNDALSTLSAMIAQWQRKRWLTWTLVDTALVATGSTSYTVNTTGSFPIARPDRIEGAFVRLLTASGISGAFTSTGGVVLVPPGSGLPTSDAGLLPGSFWSNSGVLMIVPGSTATTGNSYVDYPLSVIESREDYSRIALKTFSSMPLSVYYEPAYPVGLLHFWPIPTAGAYELHILTKQTLPGLTALSDLLTFPPEYIEAMKYALIVRLTMDWGLDPKPAHVAAARASMNTIRQANAQVPELRMPAGLGRRRGSGTNLAAFNTGWTI